MRSRIGQQRGKEQGLHHDFSVGVPRKPDRDDIESEQPRRGRGDGPSGQPRCREIHREKAEDRPDPHGPTRTGQSIDAIPDGNRRRKQVRELPDNGALLQVLDEEAHESERVVVGAARQRKEQWPGKWRHRRNHRIANDNRATLRDLNPLVHVRPGILAANDVFRRRKEPPQPECDDGKRQDGGPCHVPRCAAEPESSSRNQPAPAEDGEVSDQQALKTVAVKYRQAEDDREREREAEHDRPERALLRIECGSPVAIEPR